MTYRITRQIGHGGQGSVYLATGNAGNVALKVVEADAATFEVSRLKDVPEHPNLVKFIDIIEQEDVRFPGRIRKPDGHFIVMSHVEGPTLTNHPGFRQLSPIAWWQMLSQVLDGVDHMHKHGLIHRDLKPDNTSLPPSMVNHAQLSQLSSMLA